jgi:hypothetical protein
LGYNESPVENLYVIISLSSEDEVCRRQLDFTCVKGRILIRTGGQTKAVSEAKWWISFWKCDQSTMEIKGIARKDGPWSGRSQVPKPIEEDCPTRTINGRSSKGSITKARTAE